MCFRYVSNYEKMILLNIPSSNTTIMDFIMCCPCFERLVSSIGFLSSHFNGILYCLWCVVASSSPVDAIPVEADDRNSNLFDLQYSKIVFSRYVFLLC